MKKICIFILLTIILCFVILFFTKSNSPTKINRTVDVYPDSVIINADMSHELRHGFYYFEDSTETINISVSGDFYHVTNENNTLFIEGESDYITTRNDTVIIDYEGDYVIYWDFTISGANGRDYRVRVNNNIPCKGAMSVSTTGVGNRTIISGTTYCHMDENEFFVLQVANITNPANTDDPVFYDGHIYVEKRHN